MSQPRTLKELKATGYRSRSVKDELRANLIERIRAGGPLFPGVVGYEHTVEPQIVNAILSRHDFILLGLRGQAKTRLLRSLIQFLDEWMPAVEGCPLHSDPLKPLTYHARRCSNATATTRRSSGFRASCATRRSSRRPDVTIADLIGDIDPIKAAMLRLDYSDERVIHYGIIPRHESRDLRDQRAARPAAAYPGRAPEYSRREGFPDSRLPGAHAARRNDGVLGEPEDYTNRGNIITPLRDRINSQIMTHYPTTRDQGIAITQQESWVGRDAGIEVVIPTFIRELVEEVAIQARKSEYVDQNSGVSARLPIALIENLGVERRAPRTPHR
jgi:magnesium chelatase subunit I